MSKHINIDEIFLRLWNGDYDKSYEKTLEETKQQLYDLMLEIIGGDIDSDFDHDDGFCQNCDFQPTDGTELCICKIVTKQRQEQRQKLTDLFGKEK